ncbi:MAG: AAA family ATPase [Phycisphaerae bacterium]|nr:AAA family ATPase [Phycisphaerae bacterium]
MPITIAVSGKGGSGKTSLAAMIIRFLLQHRGKTVLAVDADPNSCLGLTMGTPPHGTIAEIREQARTKTPDNTGVSRVQSFEYGIQQAITEAKGFDLLTMGRPEGPSCYCAANNLLRQFLNKLSSSYDFVVIDNEAGMEHLSRRTTNNVDFLFIITEPTPLGIATAKRIVDLVKDLPISAKKIGIIWNRTETAKNIDSIETIGCVPFDKAVSDASMQGKTVFDLEEAGPAFSAIKKILEQELNKG